MAPLFEVVPTPPAIKLGPTRSEFYQRSYLFVFHAIFINLSLESPNFGYFCQCVIRCGVSAELVHVCKAYSCFYPFTKKNLTRASIVILFQVYSTMYENDSFVSCNEFKHSPTPYDLFILVIFSKACTCYKLSADAVIHVNREFSLLNVFSEKTNC